MRDEDMAEAFRRLAMAAGDAIMAVYARPDFDVAAKADASPVTEADLAADRIICGGLAERWPAIPIVTEERVESHAAGVGRTHFLVDPLDGTKEFVNRRGDFTVNIALIEEGRPTAGVVYAPAVERLFMTDPAGGAVEERVGSAAEPPRRITARCTDPSALRVVASKSHRDAATDAYIGSYPVASFKSAGSSLKFCLVAAGEADLYPRLGPTMEWDTGAAQAVLEAAGGRVLRLEDGAPVRYGKPDRHNPAFVAAAAGVAVHRR